jgi:predicted amidohydrolase YtcJ
MTGQRTLFENGRILTGEALLTPAPRTVEALLVEDGLIVAAGSTKELRNMSNAAPVDLAGAFCMPGFNDAHLHLGEGARLQREVDLRGTRTLTEALGRIEAWVSASRGREAPSSFSDASGKATWISGGGWDETLWAEQRLPTRQDLDRVTGDRPAVFVRTDVHVSVANSAALRAAGIDRGTVAPPGSAIDRDAAGEPTGILREQPARALVERLLPPATQAAREQSLRSVMAAACAQGITSVQDNSIDADVAALQALHSRGELPLRVSEWLPFDAPLAELRERQQASPQDRFLRTGMLKAFLDGSLGSRTAALRAPYDDAPQAQGIAFYEQEALNALSRERAEAGFQLGFHAIGDRAFLMALAAFAACEDGLSGKRRFRVEHAQLATSAAYEQMRALGTIASIQPCHLLSDVAWAFERIGPDRAPHAYAWRRFLEAGVTLAFGTDFPVEPIDPFRNLYAAVFPGEGPAEAFPHRQLTLPQALHAYTWGSAFAEGAERWKGLLAPGFVADFIVLDRDLPACAGDAAAIRDTRVLRTVVNGQIVYASQG